MRSRRVEFRETHLDPPEVDLLRLDIDVGSLDVGVLMMAEDVLVAPEGRGSSVHPVVGRGEDRPPERRATDGAMASIMDRCCCPLHLDQSEAEGREVEDDGR